MSMRARFRTLLANNPVVSLGIHPDTRLPYINVIWDNLHKLQPFRDWLCRMGRHDYEFVKMNRGSGLMECFYCGNLRSSSRSPTLTGAKNNTHLVLYPMKDFPTTAQSLSRILVVSDDYHLIWYFNNKWFEGDRTFDVQSLKNAAGWGWITGGTNDEARTD